MHGNSTRNRETPATPVGEDAAGRLEKALSPKSNMHVAGESDGRVVPAKCPNNGEQAPAEGMEGRRPTKENIEQATPPRTQSRVFGSLSHEWLVKFIEHRVADRRILRLIRKWLRAGVSEEGEWSKTEVGTPQGSAACQHLPALPCSRQRLPFLLVKVQPRQSTSRPGSIPDCRGGNESTASSGVTRPQVPIGGAERLGGQANWRAAT
jgi:hypothetical protein